MKTYPERTKKRSSPMKTDKKRTNDDMMKQSKPVKSESEPDKKEYQRHTKSKDTFEEERDKMLVDDNLTVVSGSDGLKHDIMTSGNHTNSKTPSPEYRHIKKLIDRLIQNFFQIAFFGDEDLDKLAFMNPYDFNETYSNMYDLDNLEFIREAAGNVLTEREEEQEAKLLLKLYMKTKEQNNPKHKSNSPPTCTTEIKTNKPHQRKTTQHRTRSGTTY